MKRAAATALLCAAVGAVAAPTTYRLDPERTFVHWEVLHFGTSTVRGRFGPVDGSVTLDTETGRGELSLRIPTAGVDTGIRPFDARLREPDLLATETHPEAYFVASRWRYDGGRLAEVRGEFTLRGVGQPLSVTARRFGCTADGARCGGDFEAAFDRTDFGMTFGLPWIGNRVRLTVQVEGVRR